MAEQQTEPDPQKSPERERAQGTGDIRATVRTARRALWVLAGFTVALNLLMLVAPMYMLQVYDRVLTSSSVDTLIVLTVIAVFLLSTYAAADAGRKRVLANLGQFLGEALDKATLRKGLTDPKAPPASILENVGNLSRVQSFFINGTIAPLLDAPFVPFFLIILFLVHPLLGGIGLAGAIILFLLALLTDSSSRKTIEEAAKKEATAQSMLAHTSRQRAAIVSMGMSEKAISRWQEKRHAAIDESLRAVNVSSYLSSTTRSLRQILQVAILGGGAWLALDQQISAGAIIAGSIIMGRALAPIDQAVAIWRQVIKTRQSWKALKAYLGQEETAQDTDNAVTKMPRPDPVLRLEDFSVSIPGAKKPLLPQLSFELPRGSIVALLGPSGSGKTSLMQTLAGAWEPSNGTARLGSRDIHTWDADDRGRYVGYLPQHVELLTGTVFENIARFTDAEPEAVFTAARVAGCHDLILSLPNGYDTMIGETGTHLSAGQRQSVGLARAFFGNPALLLLDEPTAHLDAAMTGVLLSRFAQLSKVPQKDRISTFLVATHDVRLINAADQVLVIQNSKVGLMARDEYLRKVSDLNQRRAEASAAQHGAVSSGNEGDTET